MIFNLIKSSVGRKILMSISGLFLIIFLITHLGINLSIFFGEKFFNNLTHFIENNLFIKILQYVLALGFIFHIFLGLLLYIQNKNARGSIDYAINKWQYNSSFNSRSMIYTGIIILIFLIIHLYNFFIPMKMNFEINNYQLIKKLFQNYIYTLLYILSFIALAIHLSHGFQSSFQSLGLFNKRFAFFISKLGTIYYSVISLGFSIIVIWFFFFN